ncbi:bifunctional nicotinamidase/pyrazinamidase [Pleomorphomonas diazotrophica]|uniref:Nicotinamidase n=1 Tax=Pleomorphomonas diazotrophica TaxID=1166257 RepID=A0A1I4VEB3_9HYPH|nr:bifunctional nicotinamidase/pyrazinamidase [Pleomorphomonas diazotrophica]PKR90040.1 bifunctional nicotinamidase/pyrazinamidase [Pleomorphomonas diazotrophica]SFM99512.1 nicotinamidase/pyrazinamidase [Pleomorphomonas diazotrophica]
MPSPATALIVVDVQNDFCPGGALAVGGGHAIVPVINALVPRYEQVVVTQDWHPEGHASFASAHPGREPFDTTDMPYGPQVLWPDHCVQGTPGAELHPDLRVTSAQMIIRKGWHQGVDSYSAFREADRETLTGLAGYLRERGVEEVHVVGLATDYCVAWTALDAAGAGFRVSVIEDACRAIDISGSLERAWADMTAAGIKRTTSGTVL